MTTLGTCRTGQILHNVTEELDSLILWNLSDRPSPTLSAQVPEIVNKEEKDRKLEIAQAHLLGDKKRSRAECDPPSSSQVITKQPHMNREAKFLQVPHGIGRRLQKKQARRATFDKREALDLKKELLLRA